MWGQKSQKYGRHSHPAFNDGNPYNGYINPYYGIPYHKDQELRAFRPQHTWKNSRSKKCTSACWMVNILGDLNSKNNTKSILPTKQKKPSFDSLAVLQNSLPTRAAAKTYRIPYFFAGGIPTDGYFPFPFPLKPREKNFKEKNVNVFFPCFLPRLPVVPGAMPKLIDEPWWFASKKKASPGG